MRQKKLIYFVDDTEIPFILKDIRKCAEKYQDIRLFSIDTIDNKHEIPGNVKVFDDFMNWEEFSSKNILSRHSWRVMGIYLYECRKSGKILPFKQTLARIVSNIFKADQIEKVLKNEGVVLNSEVLLYSFWFYDSIFMAWLKQKYPSVKAFARAHSGDLYEDHVSIQNQVLLRHYQLSQLDALYPVSEMGTAYMQKFYPDFKQKIETIRLGTEDRGMLNKIEPGTFNLVSVASLRHHKRIHVIAESLLHTNSKINWYHFGNENLHTADPKIPEYLKRKEELKSKPNIQYFPMGLTPNSKLLDFYQTTPVNLFISLSEAEGIPVSIMEAISFGIPVLSTDVGGCAEIVNEHTGILIDLKTEPEQVAEWIENFIQSEKNTDGFRTRVREYWKSHYSEDSNYGDFFNKIEKFC